MARPDVQRYSIRTGSGIDRVMTMYDLVIFDLDGTIINSAPALIRTSKEVQAEMGLPPLPDEVLRESIGMNIIDSMRINYGADEALALDFARRFFKCYSEKHCIEVETFEGIVDTIETISRSKLTAIATNNGIDSTVGIVESLGMSSFFTEVRGVISSGSPTKAEMILDIIRVTGTDVSKAVMVGDSLSDYAAASEAGVDFIGALYGYTPDVLRKIPGIGCIENPQDLLELLQI